MSDFLRATLSIGGVIVALASGFYWIVFMPERCLKRWAKNEGLTLLSWDDEFTSNNPLWNGTSAGQHLFKVKVRTKDALVRKGFVRLGSAHAGLFSDYREEFWDDGVT